MDLEGKIAGYSKKTLAIVVALVIVAGAIFYIGAKYEKRKLANLPKNNKCVTGEVKQSKKKAKETGATQAVDSITGVITARDAKSITVKMADGTSKVITLSEASLVIGDSVVANGQANPDGSFVEQTVTKAELAKPIDAASKKAVPTDTTNPAGSVK